jgi:hypothetical protein
MDEVTVFLGAQDRYDMKLIGKKEIYLIYNANKLFDYKVCPTEVAYTKGFMNPDCVRWELHRVWVVEAKVKPGFRHILPKRIFYFDEDQPGAGTGDAFDAGGNIYRAEFAPHAVNYASEIQGSISDYFFSYDFQTGIYATTSDHSFKGGGWVRDKSQLDTFYTPESMASEGIR